MDYEDKSELKKELSGEIRKDISRDVFSRMLYGAAVISVEVFIWTTIICMAVRGASFEQAYWTCLLLLGVRALQALNYHWFRRF